MKSFLGVLGIVLSSMVYFLLWRFLGWQQPMPYIPFALMLLGVIWLVQLLLQRRTVYRFLMTGIGCSLASLFAWWTLSYSSYDTEIVDGGSQRLPENSVFAPSYATKALSRDEFLSQKTLIVFYRGHW